MNTNSNELLYHVALSKIPNIGYKLAKNLVAYCGSAQAVFESKKSDLLKIPGIGERLVSSLNIDAALIEAENEIEKCIKHDVKLLFFNEANYPRRLKHFDMSPTVLYYKGQDVLNADRTIGIVGTRKPTPRGRATCERLVAECKSLGLVIVSGLAYGVDSTAHKQAVTCQIPTVGILGHGLDRVYPSENRHLSERMLDKGGLLTEFGFGTGPDRQNFPMRNRVIAGICDAIVVVESKASGGSIITAEMANEYNKDVFAIPGRIDDESSAGCNSLIKRAKAHLIENVEDLKYVMRWEERIYPKAVQVSLFSDLTEDEQAVVDSIRTAREISIDELSYQHRKVASKMASLLLELEFKGVIRSLPGKRYMVN